MNQSSQVRISKRLSLILRHKPQSVGLQLDKSGWVNTQDLLTALESHGTKLHRESLDQIVAENPKQRFEYNTDRTSIRARQGHSVDINLGYQPSTPPDTLYHGTPEQSVSPILKEGLTKQKRHHVHLSTGIPLMLEVARRRGPAVLIEIDASQMHQDGYAFYHTENDVWLTDHIPPQYLIHQTIT